LWAWHREHLLQVLSFFENLHLKGASSHRAYVRRDWLIRTPTQRGSFMPTPNAPVSTAHHTVKQYQGHGFIAGATLGMLIGLVLSGPRFYEWPVLLSMAVTATCIAVGAFSGWGFMAVLFGAVAGQAASEDESFEGTQAVRKADGTDLVDPG
jgi:hypothetical protein